VSGAVNKFFVFSKKNAGAGIACAVVRCLKNLNIKTRGRQKSRPLFVLIFKNLPFLCEKGG